MDALSRGVTLLLLLSDLAEAAGRTAQAPIGDVGRPHGLTAHGALVQKIINVYSGFGERHPKSGPKPGYGGPLLRFVRACLLVIDPELEKRMTDKMIEGNFDRWQSKRGDRLESAS